MKTVSYLAWIPCQVGESCCAQSLHSGLPRQSCGRNVAVEPLLGGGDGDGSVVGDEDPEKDTPPRRRGSVLSDMLYGLINAIVGAPTMISFAAIIFSVSPSCTACKPPDFEALWGASVTVPCWRNLRI